MKVDGPELFSKRASAAWSRKAAELARFVNNSGRGAAGTADRFGHSLVESARLVPLRLRLRQRFDVYHETAEWDELAPQLNESSEASNSKDPISLSPLGGQPGRPIR